MKVLLTFFLLCVFSTSANAQHPFYIGLYDEVKRALQSDQADLQVAAEKLEIVSFGLLEYPELLKGVYIRLVLVHSELKDDDLMAAYMAKALTIHADSPEKPDDLSAEDWKRFQILAGLIKPEPPPLPKEVEKLQGLVDKNPERRDAWLALLQAQLMQKAYGSKNRRYVEMAVEKYGQDADLLAKALEYAVSAGRESEAKAYAERLRKTGSYSELLNEYYGLEQAKAKDWEKAAKFFAAVTKSQFAGTPQVKKTVEEQLLKLEAEKKRKDSEEQARLKEIETARADAEQKKRLKDQQIEAQKNAKLEAERKQKEQDAAEKARLAKQREDREAREAQEAKDAEAKRLKAEAKAKETKSASEKKPLPKSKEAAKAGEELPAATAKSEPVESKAENKPEPARPVREKTALELLEEAVKKSPGDVGLKLNLVESYLEAKEIGKATSTMKKFKTAETSHPRYLEVYAQFNYLSANYSSNIKVLGVRSSLSDKASYYLGLSFFESEQFERAFEALKKLDRETFPKLKEVDLKLEKELEEIKGKKAAQLEKSRSEALEKRIESGSASEAEYITAIEGYLAKRDWRAARRLSQKAQKKYETNPEFIFFAARSDFEEGNDDRALREFQRLIGSGYKQREIFYYAGVSAFRLQRRELIGFMFDNAEQNGTVFTAEIARLREEESRRSLQIADQQSLSQAINEAKNQWTRKSSFQNGLKLLRLYGVKGDKATFQEMIVKLYATEISFGERNLLTGWDMVMQGKPAFVLTLLDEDSSDEAQFLKGFAFMGLNEPTKARTAFAAIRSKGEFKGLEKYFK